jgi:two-component system, cell cycle response regulator
MFFTTPTCFRLPHPRFWKGFLNQIGGTLALSYVWARWAAQAMVGKILIVDGVATNRIVFKVALAEAFYRPVLAEDGESCLQMVRDVAPDLILLDLTLPDRSGVTLINQLRADPATRDIPVLALAAGEATDARVMALQAGADDVLAKPVDLQALLARVRNLLRGREDRDGLAPGSDGPNLLGFAEAPAAFAGPATISIMGGKGDATARLHASLTSLMTDKIIIQSREEVFIDAAGTPDQPVPDVFLIDASVAGNGGGLRVMSELRSRPATRHSAVCIIRPKGNKDGAAIAYDLGADDVVDADMPPLEIAERLKTLIRRKRREDHMRATVQDGLRLAVIDPLTGLHNRRYALPQLAAIAERATADASVFAVMVIDLDRFKSVNDLFGHAAGDAVLVEVARRLQANLRSDDLLARIGGEEFLVALPNTNFEDACTAADRLCRAIEERPIPVGFAANLRVTVSIGLAVSTSDAGFEPTAKIIGRADRALLTAKSEGRNQVTISRTAA